MASQGLLPLCSTVCSNAQVSGSCLLSEQLHLSRCCGSAGLSLLVIATHYGGTHIYDHVQVTVLSTILFPHTLAELLVTSSPSG